MGLRIRLRLGSGLGLGLGLRLGCVSSPKASMSSTCARAPRRKPGAWAHARARLGSASSARRGLRSKRHAAKAVWKERASG